MYEPSLFLIYDYSTVTENLVKECISEIIKKVLQSIDLFIIIFHITITENRNSACKKSIRSIGLYFFHSCKISQEHYITS